MIKDQKPDLILLDIGLPDIDGFELCKTLRSDESTKKLSYYNVDSKNRGTVIG
ncbi:MAG: hypothetical protein CM1200mP16_06000 [Nitrospina sp.]|nr:MAG: hypothetical protein CM1200mP16_06000 [Nitrospina sp.]